MNFIKGHDLGKIPIWVKVHPGRKCIYDEAKTVLRMKKDTKEHVLPQIERYRTESFPEKFGLHETGIVLRRHMDEGVMRLGNMWAKEIMDGSHRDQLSFDYCVWKTGIDVGPLKVGNLLKDRNFRMRRHGS